MTTLNLTQLAKKLGKNKSTISRHVKRLKLGTYGPNGLTLTEAEAKKVAAAVVLAKSGNPNFKTGKGL